MNQCEHFQEWMNDAVDGQLPEDAMVRLEAHLASCSTCRLEMEGIQSLVAAGSALPSELEPNRDLWPGIQSRLDGAGTSRRKVHRLLAVVAALVVAGVGLVSLRNPDTRPQAMRDPGNDVVAAANSTATLDEVQLEYRHARSELLALVRAREGEVSPETWDVIEGNLALIDRAIDDIEKALAANPDEGRLDRHLRLAYHRQIEMLRWAVRMPPSAKEET